MSNDVLNYVLAPFSFETDSEPAVVSFSTSLDSFTTDVSVDGSPVVATFTGPDSSTLPDGLAFSVDGFNEQLTSSSPLFSGPVSDPTLSSGTFLVSSGGITEPLIVTDLGPVTCYCTGTMILTDNGEVPVEELVPTDKVITYSGRQAAVLWRGGWQVDLDAQIKPERVRPVRILAGALGDNVPHRDLYVSPDHSLYLDGVLIPAHLLINGATITQPVRTGVVRYHHVQVEPHDVLLAEGAAAESFLDLGHTGFTKRDEEPKTWEDACAPIVLAGPQLAHVRKMLAARAQELLGNLIAA